MDRYGGMSAERLSRMTHAEAPWRVARGGLADGEPSRHRLPAQQAGYQRSEAIAGGRVPHRLDSGRATRARSTSPSRERDSRTTASLTTRSGRCSAPFRTTGSCSELDREKNVLACQLNLNTGAIEPLREMFRPLVARLCS